MKAVYTERHRGHDPQFFLVRGVVKRTTEQPERADRLLKGLADGKHTLIEPTSFGQGPRARVHSPAYLGFLESAWEEWSALPDSGPEMIANIHPVRHAATYPTHIVGKLGWHTVDTACPIGPGTWAGACAATDVATTAAQLVMDGEDAVYALCRPPGHHAYRDQAGGFCFLNNTAIAAAQLRQKHERVAILDVDVHHGNGTQGIFYLRGDVFTVSIHADPVAYYPFVWGYAHERGEGDGQGANLNIPLPIGTGDDGYIAALGVAKKAIDVVRADRAGAGARSRCFRTRSARRAQNHHRRLSPDRRGRRPVRPAHGDRAGGRIFVRHSRRQPHRDTARLRGCALMKSPSLRGVLAMKKSNSFFVAYWIASLRSQ